MRNLPSPRDIERWFPTKFEDLAGLTELKMAAFGGLKHGLPNTLITGQRGSGKTRFVYLYAMASMCTGRGDDPNPCGDCGTCRKMGQGRDHHYALDSAVHDSRGCYFIIDCESITESKLAEAVLDARAEQVRTIVYLDQVLGLARRGLQERMLKQIDETPCTWIASTVTTKEIPSDRRRSKVHLSPEFRRRFSLKLSTIHPNSSDFRAWIVRKAEDWGFEILQPEKTIDLWAKKSNRRVSFAKGIFAKAALYDRKVTLDLVEKFNFESLD